MAAVKPISGPDNTGSGRERGERDGRKKNSNPPRQSYTANIVQEKFFARSDRRTGTRGISGKPAANGIIYFILTISLAPDFDLIARKCNKKQKLPSNGMRRTFFFQENELHIFKSPINFGSIISLRLRHIHAYVDMMLLDVMT